MSYGPPQYPPQYGQPQYGQPQYAPPPYGYPPGMPPQQPSGGWSCGFIALIVLGVCVLFCCGGGVGLYIFGMSIIQEELKEHLAREPAVQQHVGRIREMKIVSSKLIDGFTNEYVVEIIGDRGGAKATFEYEKDDGILSGDLTLPDDTTVPLGEE